MFQTTNQWQPNIFGTIQFFFFILNTGEWDYSPYFRLKCNQHKRPVSSPKDVGKYHVSVRISSSKTV